MSKRVEKSGLLPYAILFFRFFYFSYSTLYCDKKDPLTFSQCSLEIINLRRRIFITKLIKSCAQNIFTKFCSMLNHKKSKKNISISETASFKSSSCHYYYHLCDLFGFLFNYLNFILRILQCKMKGPKLINNLF